MEKGRVAMAEDESATEEFDYALTIDGKTHGVLVEDLELWEVEVLEESGNCGVDELDWNRASTLRALAYVVMHRADPRFTMDDARHLTLRRLTKPEDEVPVEAKKRPTRAAKAA